MIVTLFSPFRSRRACIAMPCPALPGQASPATPRRAYPATPAHELKPCINLVGCKLYPFLTTCTRARVETVCIASSCFITLKNTVCADMCFKNNIQFTKNSAHFSKNNEINVLNVRAKGTVFYVCFRFALISIKKNKG